MRTILLFLLFMTSSSLGYALTVESRIVNNETYYYVSDINFYETFETARRHALEIVNNIEPIRFELANGTMMNNFIEILADQIEHSETQVFSSNFSIKDFKSGDLKNYKSDYNDCEIGRRLGFVVRNEKNTISLCKYLSALPIELQAQVIIHEAIHLTAYNSDDLYFNLIGLTERNTTSLEMMIMRKFGVTPVENEYLNSDNSEETYRKLSFTTVPDYLFSPIAREKLKP